jgi:hypothetical protein
MQRNSIPITKTKLSEASGELSDEEMCSAGGYEIGRIFCINEDLMIQVSVG